MRSKDWIIGVDEVGRGPLAGPLYVCAFALPVRPPFLKEENLPPLRDSKKLSGSQRKRWVKYFSRARREGKVAWEIARIPNDVIDRIGISAATRRAATRAASALVRRVGVPRKILLDGSLYLDTARREILSGIPAETLIKGDERIPAIAAASIVAKERRDTYMRILDGMEPRYGFGTHKGYGTLAHRKALKRYGPSNLHRLTFIGNLARMRKS